MSASQARQFLAPFAELGREVEAGIGGSADGRAHFSEIASERLERFDPPEPPGFAVLAAVFADPAHAHHRMISQRGGFSDLPVLLYESEEFTIEAYHWFEATTTIHDHRFSGAFKLWEGSSLICNYRFVPSGEAQALQTGELRLERMVLGEPGRTYPIIEKFGHAHSIFHLDRPTLTLVIRSNFRLLKQAQINCYPPGLAIEPDQVHTLYRSLPKMVEVERMRDPGFDLARLIATMPPEPLILTFPFWYRLLDEDSGPIGQRLADAGLPQTFAGDLLRFLEGSHLARSYRPFVQNRDRRAALALLVHAADRNEVYSGIETALGASSGAVLGGLAAELLAAGVLGGVRLADRREVWTQILGGYLTAEQPDAFLREAGFVPDDTAAGKVLAVLEVLRNNPLFSKCFVEGQPVWKPAPAHEVGATEG